MFENRSYQAELLDSDLIPREDLYQNLHELNFINTWLGGHDITIAGIKKFLHVLNNAIIADVGCGGGDNLKAIAKWARKKGITIKLIGIDLKQDCVDFATENCKDFPEISFIQSDYRLVKQEFDIIMSALFCHHLNDQQMVEYLQWCNTYSRKGFFINDLQRHPLAYYSIKYLTGLFSKSYLVKNDAALSVWRGFSRSELTTFLKHTEIKNAQIQWKWAFRYLIFANK
jgi:2-polyprenyl-3-methyl-5-hydroxy-6-metoxy-1,4-benzoquinol methylase